MFVWFSLNPHENAAELMIHKMSLVQAKQSASMMVLNQLLTRKGLGDTRRWLLMKRDSFN